MGSQISTLKIDDSGISATQLVATALGAIIVYCAPKLKRSMDRRQELMHWIRRAREERAMKRHLTLEKATPRFPDSILKLSAKELSEKIQNKTLNMLDVVTYFSKYTHEHGRNEEKVNAITEEIYDDAYSQAEKLLSGHTKDESKHLYGVPISVKECYSIKGCFSTGGMACRLRKRRGHDSLIIELLKNAGAIPLCLGNVVQTMMLSECVNNIWGRSRNPWDLTRTPGGSSGGDAALVAMKCVPLAVGGDVAGSIRIPAASCGVVGFKPTSTRLSHKGNMRPRLNDRQGTSIIIPSTIAPLARTVDDCALFMQSVCVPQLWKSDLNIPPIPFDPKRYRQKGPITVGYFKSDDWFHPCATSLRALDETIKGLTGSGYTCVPMDPPTNGWDNYRILVQLNSADGKLRSFLEALEGETIIPEFNPLRSALLLPDILRWLISLFDSPRRSYILRLARRRGASVYQVWQVLADLIEMRNKWSDDFQRNSIDAIIFPALPLPALPHGVPGGLSSSVSYMFIANLLQWPCGAVPITTVQPGEEHYNFEDIPVNQRDVFARVAQRVMKGSKGLPMSVSVMTPIFQDETCLKVMRDIEDIANFTCEPKAFLEKDCQ